jgi:hypothetical protein
LGIVTKRIGTIFDPPDVMKRPEVVELSRPVADVEDVAIVTTDLFEDSC